uniref:Uncharacterized protein n=1 Tax=Arachis duranensis TaxID=130453 RepID=N1NFY5_ARADU|nr:hypothetical protein ARAX_ADH079023-072J06-015 [Arachis duranensis]
MEADVNGIMPLNQKPLKSSFCFFHSEIGNCFDGKSFFMEAHLSLFSSNVDDHDDKIRILHHYIKKEKQSPNKIKYREIEERCSVGKRDQTGGQARRGLARCDAAQRRQTRQSTGRDGDNLDEKIAQKTSKQNNAEQTNAERRRQRTTDHQASAADDTTDG